MTILLASLFLAAALQTPSEIDLGELDPFVDRLAGRGCAGHLLVAQGERVLYARGFGLADRENERPWTRATLAPIGSITKQFTAAAVMKLVEAKRLALEDTLADHFDGVPEDKAGITLQHLLTHTSGLHDPRIPDPEWIERDELIALVLAEPLDHAPGSRYAYSNMGFSFLGAIVEERSGKSYADFVRDELLLPAGMRESGYLQGAFDRDRLSVGYSGGQRTGTLPDDVYTEYGPSWVLLGNGGILSSADEMHRWGLALFAAKVLSRDSIERMWTPRVDESNGQGGDTSYGFGWVVAEVGGRKVLMHNGGDRVNFADFALVPEAELVLHVATNDVRACPQLEEILLDVLRHALEGAPYPAR